MLSSIWVSLVLIVTAILLIKKAIRLIRAKKNLPPGPPSLPIIGNLHQLGTLPHQSLWRLSKKYGPVMFLKLGSVPTIVVSSVEAAKQVLKVHDLDCCSRPAMAGSGRLTYNYLDLAFSPYGVYWREIRKICVLEVFSAKRVQSFGFIREEEVAYLVHTVSQAASTKSVVDLSQNLLFLTAGVTCRVAFGLSFRGSEIDNDRFREIIHEALAMLGSFSAADFFPYVGWIVDRFTGLHGRRERCFHDLDVFYEEAIESHLRNKKSGDEHEDIIDVLLKMENVGLQLGGAKLTRNHIKSILADLFLAGVDTASITMDWAMTELVRHPRVMKKVQAEIREKIGNKGKVDEADLDEFQYLKLVIKETFRFHPPSVLLIPRETMTDIKITGYDIPSKTRIQVNTWAMGRDPTIWQNPEEFFPERFADSAVDYKGQHFELLPFGGGRRGCPGIYMAIQMIELALANLLYGFDWTLTDGMKEEDISIEEAPSLTVHKKIPLQLVPIKYEGF